MGALFEGIILPRCVLKDAKIDGFLRPVLQAFHEAGVHATQPQNLGLTSTIIYARESKGQTV